jgi:hypothetical protein
MGWLVAVPAPAELLELQEALSGSRRQPMATDSSSEGSMPGLTQSSQWYSQLSHICIGVASKFPRRLSELLATLVGPDRRLRSR